MNNFEFIEVDRFQRTFIPDFNENFHLGTLTEKIKNIMFTEKRTYITDKNYREKKN
jgi:hypothetical protein